MDWSWSWLSFVIGILVGWLLEWLIDFVFWRRKQRAEQAELGRLQQQLESAQGRQRDLELQALQCSRDLDACRASLDAAPDRRTTTSSVRSGGGLRARPRH